MTESKRRNYWYLILLGLLCVITTVYAAIVFESTIRTGNTHFFYLGMLTVFILLYFWIAIGFWTATFGFIRELMSGVESPMTIYPVNELPRTAIIMAIYNEDVVGVFSRMQVMCENLIRIGKDDAFYFFVLSDSTDPDIWLEEEETWARLKMSMHGRCGLYYRRRHINIGHKSGNIRDFCEHWGNNYRYMIVLDADSLMTAPAMLEMVNRMENDMKIGILQSPPMPVNRRSLFGRLQQFAAHLYGPIFTSGYALWSQVAGTYWGHNAIIRIKPFMDTCGLPKLPGKAPLGGEIFSHDFVEAAYMQMYGWKVVIAYDLKGSFEECPANLIDFAKRDQRWCQGNLQHLRLILRHGLRSVSKAQLGMGAMSYLSSPLWAIFLVLVILMGFGARTSSSSINSNSLKLFIWTTLLLLLPKLWALFLALISPMRIEGFAGPVKATLGVIVEIISSIITAPILMVFHTTFVLDALFGRSIRWETQRRTDNRVPFADAFRVHASHTIVGLAGAFLVFWLSPDIFPWMTPVLVPLILSVPISMLMGDQRIGRWLFKRKLLVIPQEIRPNYILRHQRYLMRKYAAKLKGAPHPFNRVIIDPSFNALHIALLPKKRQNVSNVHLDKLKRVALTGGPDHLSIDERKQLIFDGDCLEWLHKQAWKEWPLELIEKCSII